MRAIAVRGVVLASLLVVSALTLGACGNSIASGTLPPLTTATTESFSGSLTQGASISVQITITATAPLTISLTDVGPLQTMGLGVSLATWSGSACGAPVITQNTNARMGATALTGTAAPGTYCVTVFDSGNLPSGWTSTYTVQAVHY